MKELVVERNVLQKNIQAVRQRAGSASIMAVLKSNAYGLGLLPMAHCCRDMGITRFGITEPEDAARLREEGFLQEEILMLRSTAVPAEIDQLLDNQVIASVGSQEAALAVSATAERRGAIAEVHIEIDTGLGRYGFLPDEFDKIRSVYEYMSAIAVTGVYTHLPHTLSPKKMELAAASFNGVLDKLRAASLETGTVHALGSTALFRYKKPPVYDMVRIGAALCGRIKAPSLTPAGVLTAPITDIRWMPPGSVAGGVVHLRKPCKIGLVPLGYADGVLMNRPAQGFLPRLMQRLKPPRQTVRDETGTTLRILGHLGQNHLVLDLTHSPRNIGDTVVINVNPLFVPDLPRTYR